MKLYQSLYGMIWAVLMEFLLAMTPTTDVVHGYLVYVHIALGLVLLGLAFYNFDGLRKTRVPARVKRIAKSTFQLSILMAITGVLLAINLGAEIVIPVIAVSIYGLILLVHVVNAFAIITQAAAVAIAHDMWEDKEFVKETEAGEVPAPPTPAKPAAQQTS